MILRAIEHRLPWMRMQQILNELLVALSSFDCHRALGLLAESVAEYNGQGMEIRDYVWTRKQALPHASDAKIADFAAKRRSSEAGNKPGHEQRPA
jgi:hypothetical protein